MNFELESKNNSNVEVCILGDDEVLHLKLV